jgi:hypothetical protein
MNAQNPRPRYGPGSRPIFCAPGECTPMMSQIDLLLSILDKRRADATQALACL